MTPWPNCVFRQPPQPAFPVAPSDPGPSASGAGRWVGATDHHPGSIASPVNPHQAFSLAPSNPGRSASGVRGSSKSKRRSQNQGGRVESPLTNHKICTRAGRLPLREAAPLAVFGGSDMTTNSININQANQAEIITDISKSILDGQADGRGDSDTVPAPQSQAENRGKPESELRAASRRHGYTLKELAALMGASYSHLCSVANGHRPWTPELREKVRGGPGRGPRPGRGLPPGRCSYQGESSVIRERAREQGMTLKDLALVVGMSYRYMTQVARGQRNMSPSMQVQGGVGPGRSGGDRPRPVRQPPGVHRRRTAAASSGSGPGRWA